MNPVAPQDLENSTKFPAIFCNACILGYSGPSIIRLSFTESYVRGEGLPSTQQIRTVIAMPIECAFALRDLLNESLGPAPQQPQTKQ